MLRFFATATVCAVLTATPHLPNASRDFTVAASEGDSNDKQKASASAPNSDDLPPLNTRLNKYSSVARLTATIDPSVAAEMGGAPDANLGTNDDKMPAPELTQEAMCLVLREVAAENNLPEALFARLIWQESRFRKNVVSPVGAQGIAQFMPGTARERGLENPFDPLQALPASAEFLRDLATQFGNFGLAAAAYNGGPGRVSRWLAGKGGLPKETRDYVAYITGKSAEHWAKEKAEAEPHPEALDVNNCDVRPLRTALAELREEARLKRDGYPSIEAANAANAKKLAKEDASRQTKPLLPWIAMLAGNWTEKRAHAVYADLKKKYPKVLGSRSPTVRVARAGGKKSEAKTFVGVPAGSRAEAQLVCQRLKEAGGECTVKKDPA